MRFTGVKMLHESYAMSEVVSGSHLKCEQGNYHFSHTAIPFLLDPETSKPLPRQGRQTGRAAFFDLGRTSIGGFITGDEVTIEWDQPCSCGRHSRYVVGAIQRYSEKMAATTRSPARRPNNPIAKRWTSSIPWRAES